MFEFLICYARTSSVYPFPRSNCTTIQNGIDVLVQIPQAKNNVVSHSGESSFFPKRCMEEDMTSSVIVINYEELCIELKN